MSILPVNIIERKKWGANSILRKINNGVYIFTCTVTNIDKKYTTDHAFVYNIFFKLFGEENCCGAPIDIRKYTPIIPLDENGR